jgi:uncharacterized protein (DUF488 family)
MYLKSHQDNNNFYDRKRGEQLNSDSIHLYTIGFTQKTAQQFFELLNCNGIDILVDTRLKPDSQLSGFAKGRDLPYLLKQLSNCEYQHEPLMCPTENILKTYRNDSNWQAYAAAFNQLLHNRNLITKLDIKWWHSHRACLLCSEHEPDFCHRRLVVEYLRHHWDNVEIHHLI